MEWVDGRLLRQMLSRAAQHAAGARHPHRHQDLPTPSITSTATASSTATSSRKTSWSTPNDHIKLIDFGIAANVGSRRLTFAKLVDSHGHARITSLPSRYRADAATPAAMSMPLGVMLYEMLTGQVPFTGPNPFVIMNDRLLNNPVPPRELNPSLTPQVQEVLYRALERVPAKRYRNAREFAHDLEHLDEVTPVDRQEMHDWKRQRSPWLRRILLYVGLALLPIVIFALLLWVAHHA